MIRYRWPSLGIDPKAAALCAAPLLARLKSAGPWFCSAGRSLGGVEMVQSVPGWTPQDPDAWGPDEMGLDGCFYSIHKEAEAAIDRLLMSPPPADAARLTLACGRPWWILPAYRGPIRIDLHGNPAGLVGCYSTTAEMVWSWYVERQPLNRPEVMDLIRMALASCAPQLTAELAHGVGLITSRDFHPILEATWSAPKIEAAG